MAARLPLLHILIFVFLVQLPSAAMAQSSDAYAIYSDLIAKSLIVRTGPGNVPIDDEIYLIEATTATDRSGVSPPGIRSLNPSESCLKDPQTDVAGFREIVADYNLRRNDATTLTRRFTFAKPYFLITTKEVEQFLKDAQQADPVGQVRNVPPPINRNPLYPKAKRVFRLGDVYFNRDRTLAVVFFSVYTTTVAGTGSWRAFRKTANGQWQNNNSWPTCTWGTSR